MSVTPELLAPAGSLERLKVAVLYGANAVYLGGQKYGLRARADNFTDQEIDEGVKFCHAHGAKAYITLNAFLHDHEMDGLAEHCQFLERIGVDAAIVSDLGVVQVVRQSSNLPIHLSTQASCLNEYAAKLWSSFGIERLIVGRELSIEEAGEIKRKTGKEVEMFIHGAMCMAYSGNCTISNFTAGRDANRGGCIQSCRFSYKQSTLTSRTKLPGDSCDSHFMSSKDMSGARHLQHFMDQRIGSLKLEGRMKSVFYVATLCRAYRKAIDACTAGNFDASQIQEVDSELATIPHREYFGASLLERADASSTCQHPEGTVRSGTHRYIGLVLDVDKDFIALRLSSPVQNGDRIEILPFIGAVIGIEVKEFYSIARVRQVASRQDSVIYLPRTQEMERVATFNVVRALQEGITGTEAAA